MGCVVSGVRDVEDVGVARLPRPPCDQSLQQIAQLPGGDGGGVVAGRQTAVRPAVRSMSCGRARRADDRVGPAGDGDVVVLASAVGVAEDPFR